MGSNTEKKPLTNIQNLYKNEANKIKSDNFTRSNREKSNIAIAILKKIAILIQYQNLFCILGAPIIFLSNIYDFIFNIYEVDLT